MLKLIFFVPETHVEFVKDAVFSAGAGQLGGYDRYSWQVVGEGQFRPLDGANPFIGKAGEVTQVPEYRVETLCDESRIQAVVSALKEAHPYEEPAWEAMPLLDHRVNSATDG